jgi:hypothetical protein
MKRFTMIMMAMVAIATAAFAQSKIYVYRNDGNTVTIPDSIIQGMECSKVDSQMVTHTNYVMQIIKTASGDVKIPLSEIDSISFVKPVGDAVDLGLSVRWASYNVGANSSEDYGGYYAWGETEEKSCYSVSTYKYFNSTTIEYINIGDEISGTKYDVARVKWGGYWRLPTQAEQKELTDKCTWTWTTQNGVKGYKVAGPNGNSIFLPAAGNRDDTDINHVGVGGFYWSGTLSEIHPGDAYYLNFDKSDGKNVYDAGRIYGFPVRPVVK